MYKGHEKRNSIVTFFFFLQKRKLGEILQVNFSKYWGLNAKECLCEINSRNPNSIIQETVKTWIKKLSLQSNCRSLISFILSCTHSFFSCNTKIAWGCCPASWKSFGSSCYFISSEEKVWSKSEQNCVEMGAHFVVFNTEAEQVLFPFKIYLIVEKTHNIKFTVITIFQCTVQ